MGFIDKAKNMILGTRARETFGVSGVSSSATEALVARCANIYAGHPEWVDPDKDSPIRTVNFAASVCAETARLATLAIGIKVGGSARADWIQAQVDKVYAQIRTWTECGCAYGTVILKPNGQDVDLVTPDRFVITDTDGSRITGAVFMTRTYDQESSKYYTRLEQHRFLPDGRYEVRNRCFVGSSERDRGVPIVIDATPWAGLLDEVHIEGLDRPLFGVLRMPGANNLDPGSPLGLPVFAGALEELKDLDVAYSRNAAEIFDSQRLSLLDDRLTEITGTKDTGPKRVKLPRFVKKVFGAAPTEYYEEINPALNTEARMKGINALLSQIGFKCGFSNGYFVFNERSGMVTATQVEADDRRTIQTIADVRSQLQEALDGAIYALNAFADLYGYAPAGAFQTVYDFGDVTYNREEDRARWWGYVTQNKVPAWRYFVKFEGMTETDAKAMVTEAAPRESVPFGLEE